MNPMTKKPIAHACRIFMYSITNQQRRGSTVSVWLGALVEEHYAVVGEILQLVDYVLVLFFSVLSGRVHVLSLIT